MLVLGVDPGIRNTGYCLIDGAAKVVAHGVISPEAEGRLQPHEVIRYVFPVLDGVLVANGPVVAAGVEQVAWYGRARSITLPLSHIAGAIIGYLLGSNVPVTVLLANQRPKGLKRRASWTEHENDAYELAIVAKRVYDARRAIDSGIPRSLLAAVARTITVVGSVHGAR